MTQDGVLQDEVFGSAYASAVYISSVMKLPKDKKVYVIGMKGLEEELDEEGIAHIGGTVSCRRHHQPRLSAAQSDLRSRTPQTTLSQSST